MKALKYLLLAFFITLPFVSAHAGGDDKKKNILVTNGPVVKPELPNPRRSDEVVYVEQTGYNEYSVEFYATYSDVYIELYDEYGDFLGDFYADEVKEGDVVVIYTSDSGATEIYIYSQDDVVYYDDDL